MLDSRNPPTPTSDFASLQKEFVSKWSTIHTVHFIHL